MASSLKVALVIDWLDQIGGAEQVLLTLHEMFPKAPIYTSVYRPKKLGGFLSDADIRTGWLNRLPNGLRRFIGPLRQRWFSHLDLSDYDLVISVTGAEGKAVCTKCDGEASHYCFHLCYCHVPTQYYWQLYDDYLKEPGFGILNPLARLGLKLFVKPMRKKDFASAQQPDKIVTISNYSAEQIRKYYKREAEIINPPVDLKKFSTNMQTFSTSREIKSAKSQIEENNKIEKSQIQSNQNKTIKSDKSQTPPLVEVKNTTPGGFITTSRQVVWKRLDLCIKACLETGEHLTLIGDGPEHDSLVKLAKNSDLITFLPRMSQEELSIYLHQAKGYLFPSREPFGLAPVEALATGCPVIAFGDGGALDYVEPGKNGILFEKQTVKSLTDAIRKFNQLHFSTDYIKSSATRFDKTVFTSKIQKAIEKGLNGA